MRVTHFTFSYLAIFLKFLSISGVLTQKLSLNITTFLSFKNVYPNMYYLLESNVKDLKLFFWENSWSSSKSLDIFSIFVTPFIPIPHNVGHCKREDLYSVYKSDNSIVWTLRVDLGKGDSTLWENYSCGKDYFFFFFFFNVIIYWGCRTC